MINPRSSRMRLALLALTLGLGSCTSPADNEHHRQESIQFLESNRLKPGTFVTPTGLQYQILREGTGAMPKATDVVSVSYRGSLISGNEFDHGEDIRFALNAVIPGWTEGLQLMKEGAKYRFFLPPELAYGEAGAGRVIPPHSALVFEVELHKVEPPGQ